jgi:phosphoglycerate dehydrogenase-like enzyme
MKPGMLGKVVITAKSVAASAAALQLLRDAGCEVSIKDVPMPVQEDWLIESSRDADALVFAMEPVSARLIAAADRLKVIARPGVGYDTVDVAACTARGIPVTIAPANHESVADYAMTLLLVSARGVVAADAAVQAHRWDRIVGTEIWNKTLTIVGLGRIGKGLALRAQGFKMRILAVGTDSDADFAAQHGITYVDLQTGLREADFVSLHVPLNRSTERMINTQSLALMKRGSYLINTARGGLIDEVALAAAVRSGHLAGAAVDVLCQQGVNSPSPLIGVPGIVVTPHMATFAREAMERVALSVASSVVAVLRGQRPADVVNQEVYGS